MSEDSIYAQVVGDRMAIGPVIVDNDTLSGITALCQQLELSTSMAMEVRRLNLVGQVGQFEVNLSWDGAGPWSVRIDKV